MRKEISLHGGRVRGHAELWPPNRFQPPPPRLTDARLSTRGRTDKIWAGGKIYVKDEEGNYQFKGTYQETEPDLNSAAQEVLSHQSMQLAAGTMTSPTVYGIWLGGAAVGGVGLYAAGAYSEGGLVSLTGTTGLDLLSNQALNQLIGITQRELIRRFFESRVMPPGLSPETLRLYAEIARRYIAEAATRPAGGVETQRERLRLIEETLSRIAK